MYGSSLGTSIDNPASKNPKAARADQSSQIGPSSNASHASSSIPQKQQQLFFRTNTALRLFKQATKQQQLK